MTDTWHSDIYSQGEAPARDRIRKAAESAVRPDVEALVSPWRKLAAQPESDVDCTAEAERVTAKRTPGRMVTREPASCLECGTCCFSNLETSVRVTGDDYGRLGSAVDDLVHFVGNRAYMRLIDGHCAALRIELEGRFVCTVYETRPDACRDLERGSAQCAGELFTKEGRPAAKLVELRRGRPTQP